MTEKEENKAAEKPAQDSAQPAEGKRKEERKKRRERRASAGARRVGYIFAILFTLVFMYVLNHLLEWHVPFLTNDFKICLWVINLSLAASIVGNALFLAYDAPWFRHLIQLILDVFAFVAVYILYAIFPFAFPEAIWGLVARIVLIAIMVGVGIGFVVELVNLVRNRD